MASSVNKPRGRGRGRRENPTQSETTQPGPPAPSVKASGTKVNILALIQSGSIQQAVDYVNDNKDNIEDLLENIVEKVFNSVLENVEVVEHSAEFLKVLWDESFQVDESASSIIIRRSLLLRLQKVYTERDGLTDSSFQGFASFICELFSLLRMRGEYLAVLVAPVYTVLKDMLTKMGKSVDVLLTFHMLMTKHGLMLENVSKDKMAELINVIREKPLLENAANPASKLRICVLMEILELYAANWTQSDEAKRFYSDKIADLMGEVE